MKSGRPLTKIKKPVHSWKRISEYAKLYSITRSAVYYRIEHLIVEVKSEYGILLVKDMIK